MKKLLIVLLLLIITALMLLGYITFSKGNITFEKRARAQPTVVVVAAKEKEIMESIESIGTAKAFESVTITANVTEYVRKLHFDDGQTVKQGDILVELSAQEERSRLSEAKAKLLEAQQQFKRIKNLLKNSFSAKSEFDTQKANLDSAQAQVEQYKSQLADRVIKAPFSGILGFRQISVGTLLEPGDTVTTLDMIQQLKVDFTIPEKLLTKVKEKQPFKAKSIAYPNEWFEGHVATVDARLDEASRSIMVRGIVENQDLKLKPGMLLKIRLPIGMRKIITIPESALIAQGSQRYVFVISGDKAERRKIQILRRQGEEVGIAGKIQANEQVVSKGAFKLKSGQEVKIIHENQ